MLQFCLKNGARTDVKIDNGINVLHAAAIIGDAKTIRILRAAKLAGVDTDHRRNGMSLLENFEVTRPTYIVEDVATTEAAREAFVDLLESAKRQNGLGDLNSGTDCVADGKLLDPALVEGSEDEEEFVDARSY